MIPLLGATFSTDWIENRWYSKGVLPRVLDLVRVAFLQGDVNHVTGDVHYLTYLMRRKRTVLTIHDFVGLERSTGLKRLLLWFFWYWLPVRRVAAIIVISRSTEAQLHRYVSVDPTKVFVIHNPVRPDFRASARPFNVACPRILQVGTGPNKNFERNIRAISGFNCHLVILGMPTPSQRDLLIRLNVDYEFHFNLGSEDVAALYASCDILLFTSTYEGFGMPIIEAQASGVAVITSRTWSMPEVAGEGAITVNPEDVSAISDAIKLVISDVCVRTRLREAGFVNAARFSIAEAAAAYSSVYQRILCS